MLFPTLEDGITTHQISRALICSTASYTAPQDLPSWKWWLGVTFIKLAAGSAYAEINGMSRAVVDGLSEQRTEGRGQAAEVEWTLFRYVVASWDAVGCVAY